MAVRKEVRILLKPPVWELLRNEFHERFGNGDVANGVRLVMHLWLKKHGHDLGTAIDRVPETLPTNVSAAPWVEDKTRRCKKCGAHLPLNQFNHPSFHTVCGFCAYNAQARGDKRPGTPTKYLAGQHHYKTCRAEYQRIREAAESANSIPPTWPDWYKNQESRRAGHEKEYYEKLRRS